MINCAFGVYVYSIDPDQPAALYSLTRDLAIHHYILYEPRILKTDDESPVQAARMRNLIWTAATYFPMRGPFTKFLGEVIQYVQYQNRNMRKTYLQTCAPNVDSNQPAHPIRVFVDRMKKLRILQYPKCAQWRTWSDSLLGAHVRRYVLWRETHMFYYCSFLYYIVAPSCGVIFYSTSLEEERASRLVSCLKTTCSGCGSPCLFNTMR